jgi:radical SAM-linked protein
MHRLLFEKTGNAVYMSHLDLMRLFQRGFKRAGLNLKHSQGYNPRPMVSIALPLSVGVESVCELLDFELDGQDIPCAQILERLRPALVEGVTVKDVYEEGSKIKNLAFLDCLVTMEYDAGVTQALLEKLQALFSQDHLLVEKKGKNGISEQDIIPMIKKIQIRRENDHTVILDTRICCQNPTLNPSQLAAAVERYLPECKADFVKCRRMEIYDTEEKIFR